MEEPRIEIQDVDLNATPLEVVVELKLDGKEPGSALVLKKKLKQTEMSPLLPRKLKELQPGTIASTPNRTPKLEKKQK